ncbi:hypothetical protein MKW92_018478 [Papaver armeniacum]|nr:hypothetical protein MKW92_018478 [Papaver armeniacum]
MCISKSWESLIHNPSFIKLHRSKAQLQLLIMIYKVDSIIVYTPKNGFEGGEALYKATIPWSRGVILKHVNGLFCFIDPRRSASCVYNLATQQTTPWTCIPVPSVIKPGYEINKTPTYGFGFDPSTGQHKVPCTWVISQHGAMTFGKADHICHVFTLGDTQWRKIDEVPPVRPDGISVYANGSIYRRNRDDYFFKEPEVEVIVAFDVGTEKFRVIPIPDFVIASSETPEDSCRHLDQLLLEVDGHIALINRISESMVKLWVSDDDCIQKNTDVKWVEETIILPFQWPRGERLHFRAVQGTKQMMIHKAPLARGFIAIYIYDRITKSSREIKIVGLPRLSSPFRYGMFATHETLLPLQNKENNQH